MMRRLLKWVAGRLGQARVIYDGEGKSPYLSRWYLLGKPRMPDGSSPFDPLGDLRSGYTWDTPVLGKILGLGGVYLHRFHRSDTDSELHNHPWAWGFSLILAGGYVEERRQGSKVVTRVLKPWDTNQIRHDDFHRVDLREEDCWTLFFVGREVSSWGFWSRVTGAFMPWRAFLDMKRNLAKAGLEGRDE